MECGGIWVVNMVEQKIPLMLCNVMLEKYAVGNLDRKPYKKKHTQ